LVLFLKNEQAVFRAGANMNKSLLRTKVDERTFFVVPGIQDMITAVIADRVGFDVVYGSGYWLTASSLGLPDAGIASYTQMLDRMATLARTSKAAVIADADTGYGGLLNVHHTVRGYEAAGVSGIQIEDQEFPKKCGHTPYKRLISESDMADKIRVACEARLDAQNTLIIARTDARQSEGMDGALRRAEAYRHAGADVIFIEALMSEEEMRTACSRIDAPMMANMADGGLTPVLPANVLADIGYTFAIYPSMTSLVAAAAMERALRRLKDDGLSQDPAIPMFDFKTFCGLIGFEDVWAFERRWGRDA
jgi:2-methylisocitrate lyase-like PEP mutase family enzyme